MSDLDAKPKIRWMPFNPSNEFPAGMKEVCRRGRKLHLELRERAIEDSLNLSDPDSCQRTPWQF